MSRFIAWTAFLLGIGASTAANVAHARDGLGPRLAAAVAPVALILAVELAVRLRWRTGWRWWMARWLGTGLVGIVTAVVSYRHQSALLGTYGEDHLNAAILPLSIDGLMLVAAAALLSLGPRERVADVADVSQRHEATRGDSEATAPDVAGDSATRVAVSPATWRHGGDMSQAVALSLVATGDTSGDSEATGDMSQGDSATEARRVARAEARRRQRAAQRARQSSDTSSDSEATGD